MAANEVDLHLLVKEFERLARPEQRDPNAPVTVGELNNLVTQISYTLDTLISKLVQ